MENSNAKIGKTSHRLLLISLKVMPMVIALCYVLNTFFSYFGLSAGILSHIGGMSLIPWLFIMLATYVFKFCVYHRMFLWYILVDDLISYYDYYIGIPINDFSIFMLHNIITGIFLFIILYLYKYGKDKKNKTV